jgi:drug/metabolite transporter (DMT)-like permease
MSSTAINKRWVPQYLVLSLVWGASFAFTEAGLEIFTPLGITAVRHLIGFAVLLGVLATVGKLGALISLPPLLVQRMVVVAVLLNVIPAYLFAFAQNHVSTVVASIINSATPILTLVMILLVFRSERVTIRQTSGIAIGLVGGLFALGISPGNLGDNDPIGVVAVFGAICCYGFAIPYVRKKITPLSSETSVLATLQVGLGTLILTILYLGESLSAGSAIIQNPNLNQLWQICVLGVGTGVAYIWHFQVIERAGSAVASTITYPTLLISLLIGAIILGEEFTWQMAIGALLIALGSWITQLRRA